MRSMASGLQDFRRSAGVSVVEEVDWRGSEGTTLLLSADAAAASESDQIEEMMKRLKQSWQLLIKFQLTSSCQRDRWEEQRSGENLHYYVGHFSYFKQLLLF